MLMPLVLKGIYGPEHSTDIKKDPIGFHTSSVLEDIRAFLRSEPTTTLQQGWQEMHCAYGQQILQSFDKTITTTENPFSLGSNQEPH